MEVVVTKDFLSYLKIQLVKAWDEWLKANSKIIPENWLNKIRKDISKLEKKEPSATMVGGFAMWSFANLSNFGIVSCMGVNGYAISDAVWRVGFDRGTTENLLRWCREALMFAQLAT